VYVLLLFRPPVAAAVFLAIVPWVFVSAAAVPSHDGDRPRIGSLRVRLIIVAGGILGMAALGLIAPRYSLPQLPQTIAQDSAVYQTISGAQAGLAAGVTPVVHAATWTAIILAWPSAALLSLYRPFPWEAASIATLGAALENLLLLLLSVRALFYLATKSALRLQVLRSPLFLTCLVFIAAFSLGVGESSPNLGTISRYRIPMIPFLVATFVILEYHLLCLRTGRSPELHEGEVLTHRPPLRNPSLRTIHRSGDQGTALWRSRTLAVDARRSDGHAGGGGRG
jgi:hypothetical protein